MPINDLMKLSKDCIQRWNDWTHWRICDVRNAAPDIETIRCTDGFSDFYQWGYTQRWGDWMHWRVFGFCQRAVPDIEAVRCTGGFPIYLAVSITGVVANFWLMTQAGKLTDGTSGIYCWLQNMWTEICRAEFDWNDADRQINKRNVRNLIVDCKICKLKFAKQNVFFFVVSATGVETKNWLMK